MYNSSCYNAQYYYMHIRVETQFLSMKKQTLSQLLHLLSKKKKKKQFTYLCSNFKEPNCNLAIKQSHIQFNHISKSNIKYHLSRTLL